MFQVDAEGIFKILATKIRRLQAERIFAQAGVHGFFRRTGCRLPSINSGQHQQQGCQ
jgi:hypothetical protein